jgi:hypothetical protein
VSAGGYGEFYAVVPTDSDTQSQRPAGTLRLEVTGEVHRAVRLFLDTRMLFGGWPEGDVRFGLYDPTDTFQNFSPALDIEEGYGDVVLGPVDLRIGKQKFAWGRLDSFQPTDVLNPRWYNDPLLTDEKDAKIGIPAARATYYLPPLPSGWPDDVNLTLVWVPVPVATRFPLTEERWFPPATDVNEFLDLAPLELLPTNPIRVRNELAAVNRSPPHQLDEGAAGVRFGGLAGATDWALYYYDGQETDPVFDFDTSIVWPAARRAARRGESPPAPAAGEVIQIRADADLLPRFERIRLVGADFAHAVRGFTIRGEAVYGMNRRLPRTVADLVSNAVLAAALGPPRRQARIAAKLAAGERVPVSLGDLFEVSDTVEWGLGVDYLWRGWEPVVQVNQTIVLDDVAELLIADVDTQFLFVLRRSWLAERLRSELAVVEGVARGYTTGLARLTYDVTDRLRVRLGYLLIAGTRQSLIGEFHDNDEGFVQLRYSF